MGPWGQNGFGELAESEEQVTTSEGKIILTGSSAETAWVDFFFYFILEPK